jgi:hypothetical protein
MSERLVEFISDRGPQYYRGALILMTASEDLIITSETNMPTMAFNSGRIRKADYDSSARQLELHWDDKSVTAYTGVPQEVYRRLCSSPNPATYWEDRIADEYPKGTPVGPSTDASTAKKLSDLFGGG